MTTIRTLELHGTDPARWGEQHGESFKDDIRALYQIRLALTLGRTDLKTEDNVLALARHHLPVLEKFDAALHAELCGIARASGLTPAHIVLVNHYTDLRDLTLADLRRLDGADPGGCTAIFSAAGAHRILAQTWDMHGSAEPYALLLKVPAVGPSPQVDQAGIPKLGHALCFTITGCLGMTGLTSWGLGLTINNLNSVDATVGVVWPALVRAALRQPSAKAARDLILNAPIGSGRHYIVADDTDVFGIETSGKRKKIIRDGGSAPYFHTNHCVDAEMEGTCRILPGSTTLQRYSTIGDTLQSFVPTDLQGAFVALQRVGLPHNQKNPNDVATCGALAIDLTARNALACTGIPGPDADSIVLEVR